MSDAASITRILHFGQTAEAMSTSSEVSCAQPWLPERSAPSRPPGATFLKQPFALVHARQPEGRAVDAEVGFERRVVVGDDDPDRLAGAGRGRCEPVRALQIGRVQTRKRVRRGALSADPAGRRRRAHGTSARASRRRSARRPGPARRRADRASASAKASRSGRRAGSRGSREPSGDGIVPPPREPAHAASDAAVRSAANARVCCIESSMIRPPHVRPVVGLVRSETRGRRPARGLRAVSPPVRGSARRSGRRAGSAGPSAPSTEPGSAT